MSATTNSIDATVDPIHALAIERAKAAGNGDAVAAIQLMLEEGTIYADWMMEYNVNQFYMEDSDSQ